MNIIPMTDNKYYGVVKYDEKGLPVCHICGSSHRKLMTHVYQVHGLTAKEYKLTYGLDVRKGIVCGETRDKLRRAFNDNREIAVNNLMQHGAQFRFEKGEQFRMRYRSAQSQKRVASINRALWDIRIHIRVSRPIAKKIK